jgi:hypothetical protein
MINQLENNDIKTFIFAGKAIFTITNTNTGNRFTYKVRKAKDSDIYFVSVLTGSDNTNDYSFIGYIKKGLFYSSKKSRISSEATSFKVFSWFINNINKIPSIVQVLHEGKCGRCGRKLTTPESIERGIGPECVKLMQ